MHIDAIEVYSDILHRQVYTAPVCIPLILVTQVLLDVTGCIEGSLFQFLVGSIFACLDYIFSLSLVHDTSFHSCADLRTTHTLRVLRLPITQNPVDTPLGVV